MVFGVLLRPGLEPGSREMECGLDGSGFRVFARNGGRFVFFLLCSQWFRYAQPFAAVRFTLLRMWDAFALQMLYTNKGTDKKQGSRAPQFCLIDPRKYFPELHPNRRRPRQKLKASGSTEPQIQVRIAGFGGAPDFIL